MNKGPNQPSHRGGRRRRRRHGGGQGHPGQGQQQRQGGGQGGHHGGGGGGKRRGRRSPVQFVGPMDHSYRNAQNGQGGNGNVAAGKFRTPPGIAPHFEHPELEPLPALPENAAPRIFAFVNDLFFQTKIQDTARKLNVKVEFVKTQEEVLERAGENGDAKPSLIIFDLNNAAAKPLATIPKLRSKFKKETSILGFVSHVEGELKMKAQEAGCDVVMPRSAFSQNLPQILRRHGASEEAEAGM